VLSALLSVIVCHSLPVEKYDLAWRLLLG
jgi:hypothetical protein